MARKSSDPTATDVAEEQPARGGSWIREADGTLTQIEGHGFAEQSATPPSDASASPTSTVKE
jgi:hypothetical protein